MLYFFRLLLFTINIDQETVLNWFGMKDPTKREIREAIENSFDLNITNLQLSSNVSLQTFRLIVQGLWEKIQDGLTLADIENILFFILFIRFVIPLYNICPGLYQ